MILHTLPFAFQASRKSTSNDVSTKSQTTAEPSPSKGTGGHGTPLTDADSVVSTTAFQSPSPTCTSRSDSADSSLLNESTQDAKGSTLIASEQIRAELEAEYQAKLKAAEAETTLKLTKEYEARLASVEAEAAEKVERAKADATALAKAEADEAAKRAAKRAAQDFQAKLEEEKAAFEVKLEEAMNATKIATVIAQPDPSLDPSVVS